jgi:VRR-NUC domain
MAIRAATPLADLTEKEWQAQVVELAKTLGWKRVYHVFDSRRSSHGFPDLLLVRERLVLLELKRETGRLTEHQKGWLRDLLGADVECYVARPSDLERVADLLQHREGDLGQRQLELLQQTHEEAI